MTGTSTQQLILEAVITCIEKYGVENTTTRKIASEAGTNIASINYYFRSKDDLIARALEVTLNHMQEDLIAIVQAEEEPFESILRAWIIYLVEGAQRYPNVFMAHMYAPLVEKRFDTAGVETFRSMLEILVARAIQAYPHMDPVELRQVLTEVLSAMIFRMLAPGMFPLPEELSSIQLAEKYIHIFTHAIEAH